MEVVTASRGEVVRTRTFEGQVVPSLEVNIIPKLGGKVAQVLVEVGDRVRAGQVLVRLDATDIEKQVEQARAGVATAQAQLAQVKAGTRPEQIEAARQQVKQAEAAFSLAQANLERTQFLFSQGAVPQSQLDQVQMQFSQAEASLEAARQQLAMAEAGPTAEQVAVGEAQVNQARAALATAEQQLANTVITAPVSGIVTAVMVDPGEMAGPSMPVAVIAQLDTVQVNLTVPESDINYLQTGSEVEVSVAALGDESFTGRVSTVSPVADARTRSYQVKVELPNPEGMLKGGMSANVTVALEKAEGVIVVPKRALLPRNGKQVLFVADGDTAHLREVKLGLAGADSVAVLEGVAAGEKVITVGQEFLADGQQIRIVGGNDK